MNRPRGQEIIIDIAGRVGDVPEVTHDIEIEAPTKGGRIRKAGLIILCMT